MLPKNDRRRALLVLTPLIDVLFLLLIFFMLSSQIAPYSLIPLGGVFQADQAQPSQGSSWTPAAAPIVVRVAHGYVSIGSDRMVRGEFKAAVERYGHQNITRYLLIPTATAEVQDMVSALEALKTGAAAEVTLLNPARGAP